MGRIKIKTAEIIVKFINSKQLYYFVLTGLCIYFLYSFYMLTRYPIESRDESWFSETSYFFLKNGYFNSCMFDGLKEAYHGWVGHGAIYFLVDTVSFFFFGVGLLQARLPVFLTSFVILLLIYKIALLLYEKKTALLSVLLVAISIIFFRASHAYEAHIFLLFIQLLTIYLFLNSLKERKGRLITPLLIGILSVGSLEIHWIGSLIPIVMLFLFILNLKNKVIQPKSFVAFLLGGFISLVIFIYYRFVVLGSELFWYKFSLYYEMGSLTSYPRSFINEFNRYQAYFGNYKYFEILPLLITAYYAFKFKNKSDRLLLIIITLYACLMALLVKNKNYYFILFFPFFYILTASVIVGLLRKLGSLGLREMTSLLILLLIIPYFLFYDLRMFKFYGGANFPGYINKLKKYIPQDASVMGPMFLWYGFYNQPYFDNLHYIDRILGREEGLNKLTGNAEEIYAEKHNAFFKLLRRKRIKYLILDDCGKGHLQSYGYLKLNGTEKGLVKIAEIEDRHYFSYHFKPVNTSKYFITEIYKVLF